MTTRTKRGLLVMALLLLLCVGAFWAANRGAGSAPPRRELGSAASDDESSNDAAVGTRRRRRTAATPAATTNTAAESEAVAPDPVSSALIEVLQHRLKPGAVDTAPNPVDPTRVRVTGPDGKPLAGARVELSAIRRMQAPRDWAASLEVLTATSEPAHVGYTDANGDLHLPELADAHWEMQVSRDGYSVSTPVYTGRGSTPLDVQLSAAHTLSGRVSGSDGRPRAGLLVFVTDRGESRRAGERPNVIARSATDENGHFEIDAVAAGEYELRVAWPDGLPVFLGPVSVPQDDSANFTIVTAGTLHGTVTDEATGEPVSVGRVLALGKAGYLGMTRTDERGAYDFELLGTGPVIRLVAWKQGYTELAHADVPVEAAQGTRHRRDFAMYRGGSIVGHVRGPDGPIAGARILSWVGGAKRYITHYTGTTDAQGNYRIDAVRPGLALVEVHATGFLHPGVPTEMQRWGDLLEKKLDERCRAQVVEYEDVRLDVVLDKTPTIPR